MLKLQIFFRIQAKIFFYANLCIQLILLQEMVSAQDVFQDEIIIKGIKYRTYPFTYDRKPALPSPFLSDGNREVVLLKTKDNKYAFLDVTQENGHPFNYQGAVRGKGNQLYVDTLDFPALAYTGLHSLIELSQVQSITGLSAAEITYQGSSGRLSGAGFMAGDEDIVSVLLGDNLLVSSMGLTHRDLSKALIHLWNTVLYMNNYENRANISPEGPDTLFYSGKKIWYSAPNCRGWQYSLFNDSIQGECHLELRVILSENERSFIESRYDILTEDERNQMIESLTRLHTGEMAAYYIQYYGFYEGHTEYRADPIKLAFLFGLKSIEELYEAFGEQLYGRIIAHHLPGLE